MAVNKHFHTSNYHAIASEQNLVADLVAEAIQIHGHDVYYLDRTLVAEDTVFGTDALSKYETQDHTTASQEYACTSEKGCEIVDITPST